MQILNTFLNNHFLSSVEYIQFNWGYEQFANVHQFVSKEDYDNCQGLSTTDSRQGPAVYRIKTGVPGAIYYLANGLGTACQDGWKVTVEVFSN